MKLKVNGRRTIAVLLVLAMMLALLAGCGSSSSGETADTSETPAAAVEAEEEEEAAAPEEAAEPEESEEEVVEEEETASEVTYPITVTDMGGREVTIESEVQTIAIAWWMVNDFVLALGLVDKLVAGWTYDEFQLLAYPQFEDMDFIGRGKPDLELLADLNPDLFIHRTTDPDSLEACDELGIAAIGIYPESSDQLLEAVALIGEACGVSDRADYLIDLYNSVIEIATSYTETLSEDELPTFVVLGSDPGYVSPNGMMQAQMILNGGGINVAAEASDGNSWVEAGEEQVFAWDPEYVFVGSTSEFTVEDLMNDPAWADMTAVKNGNVYQVPCELHPWQNLNMATCLGSVWALMKMHPEAYSEDEFDALVTDFYKQVYDYDVTRELLGY